MALFPATSLWPGRDRTPILRLAGAFVAAPLAISAVLALVAFVIAGMTEQSAEGVWRVTFRSAVTLSALVVVFTLTFGLAGVALLWRRASRGAIAWAVTGGVAGALAGALFAVAGMSAVSLPVVIAFALAGLGLFLLIRLFAGVRRGAATADRPDRGVGPDGPVWLSNG